MYSVGGKYIMLQQIIYQVNNNSAPVMGLAQKEWGI